MEFNLTLSERSFWVHCVVGEGGLVAGKVAPLPPGGDGPGCAHRQRDTLELAHVLKAESVGLPLFLYSHPARTKQKPG